MFVSVYLHYISVGIETMLKRFYDEAPGDFHIPANVDEYIETDDIALWSALRTSDNQWAKRIATRQTFRRLVEFSAQTPENVDAYTGVLDAAGVEHFVSNDKGLLSKNPEQRASRPIFVHDRDLRRTQRISDRAEIFRRYERPIYLTRIYVDGNDLKEARRLISGLSPTL